jgi:hypothetical protein
MYVGAQRGGSEERDFLTCFEVRKEAFGIVVVVSCVVGAYPQAFAAGDAFCVVNIDLMQPVFYASNISLVTRAFRNAEVAAYTVIIGENPAVFHEYSTP